MDKHFKSILILVFLLTTYPVSACMCVSSETLKERISKFLKNEEGLIFKGKVIYHGPDSNMNAKGRNPTVNIFEIESSWSGLDKKVNFIKIFEDGTNCDFLFKQDSIYLVYAYTTAGHRSEAPFFNTDKCTDTKLFSLATADIISLGKPQIHETFIKPVKAVITSPEEEKFNIFKYISIFSITLNIFILILLIRQKKKRH